MKYLFLILLSFNAFAEFRVNVCKLGNFDACKAINPIGEPNFGGEFQTAAKAEEWVQSKVGSKDWGEEERVKAKAECSQEELAIALEEFPPTECEVGEADCIASVAKVKLPKMYTTIILDITQEKNDQRLMVDAANELAKGQKALILFKMLNKKKGLTKAQRKTLLSDPKINQIMSTLQSGTIDVAIDLIQAYVADGVLVTESDKTALVNALSQ